MNKKRILFSIILAFLFENSKNYKKKNTKDLKNIFSNSRWENIIFEKEVPIL
jgi:hypothetical protein